MMFPLNAFAAPLTTMLDPSHYGPDEKGWYDRSMHFFTAEAGYVALQTTKPQTLAYGLNDSPTGLCAWILEKRRTWSGCDGDVEKAFTKDELLTVMTLYWVTQSFGTSARYYYEAAHNLWQPSQNRTPVIEAPTGVAVFPKDIILLPRTWADGTTTSSAGPSCPPVDTLLPWKNRNAWLMTCVRSSDRYAIDYGWGGKPLTFQSEYYLEGEYLTLRLAKNFSWRYTMDVRAAVAHKAARL